MRNKLAILALVVVVSLVAVAPALAAGPGWGKAQLLHEQRQLSRAPRQPFFALAGVITAIDADGGTITVQVQSGNWVVKQYIGQQLTIQVTETTRYRQWTPQGCVPIEFGEVSVEDTASVQGVLSDGAFVAQRVTVDVPLNCCTP
jgi:hypothetical protein